MTESTRFNVSVNLNLLLSTMPEPLVNTFDKEKLQSIAKLKLNEDEVAIQFHIVYLSTFPLQYNFRTAWKKT